MGVSFAEVLNQMLQPRDPDPTPGPGAEWLTPPMATPQWFQLRTDVRGIHQPDKTKGYRLYQSFKSKVVPEPPTQAQEGPALRVLTPAQEIALNQLIRLGARHLSPNSSGREIQRSYRQLALKLHPDRNGHLPPEERQKRTEQFMLAREAFELLSE